MLRNCSSALLLSTAAAETGLRVVSGRALSCVVGGVTTALVTVLRPRAKVSMAGVTIGRVSAIEVDLEYGEAIVSLEINGEPGSLSLDTGAQILTEGILGARYVSLLPGADEETLGDGDYIENTQGALVLENLVGDLITRLGAQGG